ncbi:MAG: response regulator [Cyanobacteria bacterium J06623_7]
MSLKKYSSHQLISLLDSWCNQNSSGTLSIQTRVDTWEQQRCCILVWRQGALVYGGVQIPQARELCLWLGKKLKPDLIKTALAVAIERTTEPNSAVELLELLIKMRVFTWQEIETEIGTQIVLMLEKFISYPGESQWRASCDLDLCFGQDCHGLNWRQIELELKRRQKIWQSYRPQIPSLDAVPVVTRQQLRLIDNPQVKNHFQKSVDGRRSLREIADKLGKDPIKVAQNYLNWVNNQWVSFVEVPVEVPSTSLPVMAANQAVPVTAGSDSQVSSIQNLPTVLSVDDSAIVQIAIKRALQSDYNVLLATKAAEALEILQEVRVELLLLDLTMPDIDGLELCKTIRSITQFRDLPIVMLTARDGLVNKMKGQIAGSNRYLTKPFKAEELQAIARQYIK